MTDERVCGSASLRSLILTLLFLNAAGLRRTWDLRGYAGDGLGLLTGRRRAYGYRHVERFLAKVAHAGGADTLTNALAAWTATLWQPHPSPVDVRPPTFYIDGHRKAVFSDRLIPRGLVVMRGTVLGCRALTLLHDAQGHPLLATTGRGDLHLTVGAPALLERFAQATVAPPVRRLVIDREGMAAEFLRQLAAEGCDVVTVLRADQYAGLTSFSDIGPFMPLRYDRHGTLARQVAPARYSLALPDHPGEQLELCVALVRDLHALVPNPQPTMSHAPSGWLDDLDLADAAWYREGWVATPAPATPTEPKLIPVVTTARDLDAVELARTYFDRWPQQENCIKDWLIELGLDTNHGYAKTPVENSEVAKRRVALERRLANLERWAQGARRRYGLASQRYARFWEVARERQRILYQDVNRRLWDLQKGGVPEHIYRAEVKACTAAADAQVDALCQRAYKAHDASRAEWSKCERYPKLFMSRDSQLCGPWESCAVPGEPELADVPAQRREESVNNPGYCREQRTLLRELEDVVARERTMHELDNGKDQIMTVMKLALTNLAMTVRDQWFPATYAHATWRRLAPFFRLPGRVIYGPKLVIVELRPFNDRQLNRDLAAVCARVAEAQPRLLDGRRLVLTTADQRRPILDFQQHDVA